jgi:alkylresorcinol/alkylpyrone synthase
LNDGPAIAAVHTAVPRHTLAQADLQAFAGRFFAGEFRELPRLLRAFDHAGVHTRQLARPLDWFDVPRSFPEKNAVWQEVALELAEKATRGALERADVPAADLGAIVFVSSTGLATPSLDARLVQNVGMSRAVSRVPIWGLGCAGGAAGLARGADLCRGTGRPILVVAVEVCSATFVHEDRSKSNLIATALFGDGAAAVVLRPHGPGPRILAGHSRLLDDSEDVMGWILRPEGLQVRFARSIPAIVREVAPTFVSDAAAKVGASRRDLRHFVLHPGGAKVLAAWSEALDLPESAIAPARAVLGAHGNMSSPTALFVLERFLADTAPADQLGALVGLGPGFSAEGVIFRW